MFKFHRFILGNQRKPDTDTPAISRSEEGPDTREEHRIIIVGDGFGGVKCRETERVSCTRYQSGDFIFQQGEPRTDFYVVLHGEVEVLRDSIRSPDGKVAAVFGPGSFFGEKSLLNAGPRITSVRARSEVEVLVMGKNVFTQISPALGPLRDALAQTLNSHAVSWGGKHLIDFRMLKVSLLLGSIQHAFNMNMSIGTLIIWNVITALFVQPGC